MLGAPIYPSAVYLTSYDAGRGQRFYIFGATVPFADLVRYYKTMLKQKGDELFDAPPTHQFETARFRDESMAFAPSVTIKDYTYGGSAGYPNPKPGCDAGTLSRRSFRSSRRPDLKREEHEGREELFGNARAAKQHWRFQDLPS